MLGSYVRGTATVAAVDAFVILLGLLILQVPLALPLAVLVFRRIHPDRRRDRRRHPRHPRGAGGERAGPALVVVAVVMVVQQLEGNFLQPVVMGRR